MKKPVYVSQFAATAFFYCLVVFISPDLLLAQPTVSASAVGCQATINATVSPMNSLYGETSVDLFYRLDGTNGEGSYYWSDFIKTGTSGSPTTLSLPVGTYDVVSYETRKGGPIKTGKATLNITTLGSCTGTIKMPTMFAGPPNTSPLMLNASWNVFTNFFYSSPPTNYYAPPTSGTNSPGSPWLFVTLSVSKWITGVDEIKVTFDGSILDYGGAIADNFYGNQTNSNWRYIQSVIPGGNTITVKRTSNAPPNGETHVHLIFKNKSGVIISAPGTTKFDAAWNTPTHPTATTTALVRGGPHDPNGLVVDKRQLCACQTNEDLTYTVHFQNVGTGPTPTVKVKLVNFTYLDPASVQILPNQYSQQKTFLKNADIVYTAGSANVFTISQFGSAGLHGTKENVKPKISDEQASDYFKFKIKKSPCTPAGVSIQPKVEITFLGQAPILTNLEKTDIVNTIAEKPCKAAELPSCLECSTKKRN